MKIIQGNRASILLGSIFSNFQYGRGQVNGLRCLISPHHSVVKWKFKIVVICFAFFCTYQFIYNRESKSELDFVLNSILPLDNQLEIDINDVGCLMYYVDSEYTCSMNELDEPPISNLRTPCGDIPLIKVLSTRDTQDGQLYNFSVKKSENDSGINENLFYELENRIKHKYNIANGSALIALNFKGEVLRLRKSNSISAKESSRVINKFAIEICRSASD